MIIPQISKAEKSDLGHYCEDDLVPPTICPICGTPTAVNASEQLYCTNPECNGKLINKLDHFFGKKGLDVKGISKATFEKLIDWGWVKEIFDVFSLTYYGYEWQKKPGFGEKSVAKILDVINQSRENCPLDRFICAIGIPQIGTVASKQIADKFESYHNFREAVQNKYDFSELEDFGFVTADAILNFNYKEADRLAKILNITYEKSETTSDRLQNKKVAITGTLTHYKNRKELEAVIAAAGGKVVSSVTSNTDILINNNPDSSSSKNTTAKRLGIPILTEEAFLESYVD